MPPALPRALHHRLCAVQGLDKVLAISRELAEAHQVGLAIHPEAERRGAIVAATEDLNGYLVQRGPVGDVEAAGGGAAPAAEEEEVGAEP